MDTYRKTVLLAVTGLLLPFMGSAQGIAGEMTACIAYWNNFMMK